MTSPHTPVMPISPEMGMPLRELIDELGDYYVTHHRFETVKPIATRVLGLNPAAWPPCKCCRDGVNCDAYDPDTDTPHSGETR